MGVPGSRLCGDSVGVGAFLPLSSHRCLQFSSVTFIMGNTYHFILKKETNAGKVQLWCVRVPHVVTGDLTGSPHLASVLCPSLVSLSDHSSD